jgi:hypothetical protein
MLKRVILILVAITLVSWFVKVQLDNRRDEGLYNEKREQYLERAKGRVESLKLSSGGSFDWSEKLGSRPVNGALTIGLEKELVQSGPTLFTSTIVDVVTLNETHYQMSLVPGYWSTPFINISLLLQVEKEVFNKFLLENPTVEFYSFDTVVVAVQLTHFKVRESTDAPVVGYGELIGIVSVKNFNERF